MRLKTTLGDYSVQLSEEWDVLKNGSLSPFDVSPGSGRKVWWRCSLCTFRWEATVASRARNNRGCPLCSGTVLLPGFNDLSTLFPKMTECWNYRKNSAENSLDNSHPALPVDVHAKSGKKVWWWCEKGHEWKATVIHRTQEGKGCPFCSGQRVLPGFNDLASQYPEVAYWLDVEESGFVPYQLTAGSNRAVIWWCENGFPHTYTTTVWKRINGEGCPFCAGKRIYRGFNDLATTHPNVASHAVRVSEMLTVSFGSRERIEWNCSLSCGETFVSAVSSRVSSLGFCRSCIGKKYRSEGEKEVFDFLVSSFPHLSFESSNRSLLPGRKELDIVCEEIGLAIEYNGDYWHSEKISQQHCGMSAKERHQEKVDIARQVHVTLLFVWESDWKERRENTQDLLYDVILSATNNIPHVPSELMVLSKG